MEKKVLVNLHGFNVPVILSDAKRMARSSHYTYGQIYLTCPIDISYDKLKQFLERIYLPKLLVKFNLEQLYTDEYCYILGEKRRRIGPFSYLEPTKNDIIVKDDEELISKLKKLAYDIILSRVRKYEEIMKTKKHDIKITTMSAARGKNYYKKALLTFSSELIHFSIDLIDAIVVHELAHDFYQDHSQKFYSVVYTYCPDYDQRIKKLSYGEKK